MSADPLQRIHSKCSESDALLQSLCRRIIWQESSVLEARRELLDFWRTEWEETNVLFKNNRRRILDAFRLCITTATQREDVSAASLYCLRSLLSARHAGLIGASVKEDGELLSLLGFLEGSRLSGEFNPIDAALRREDAKIPAVCLAKDFLAHNPFSTEFLKAVLAYAVDVNGFEDFSSTIGWGGWHGLFARRKSLCCVWPGSLRGKLSSRTLPKLPPRIQQDILASEELRLLCLNSKLLESVKCSPLSFKNSVEGRFQTLSRRRFIRQPWRTFRRILDGTVSGKLLESLWVPEVLNRLKPKMKGFWAPRWIYRPGLLTNLNRGDGFYSALNPEFRCFLRFLEAGTPAAKIEALTHALRDVSSFPKFSLDIPSLQSLILSTPEQGIARETLADLSAANPSLWQEVSAKLPPSILKLWSGSTDVLFLRWLFGEAESAPAPFLVPFRRFILSALESGAIPLDGACLGYLKEVPLEGLAVTPAVGRRILLLSHCSDPKVTRWFKDQWKAFAGTPDVRGEFSKLILRTTPKIKRAVLGLLHTTQDWIHFIEESGLLAKGGASGAVEILKGKAWKGGHSVARELLFFLLKPEGRQEFPRMETALKLVMLTDVQGFADELARFYPKRAGAELWRTKPKAMLVAACGSPRTADWIAKNVPHAQLHPVFEKVRASLSSRPTLCAAIEVAAMVGIRELPQITRLAFKRWAGSPKDNKGRSFDDLYYSWPLPKKSGGTRTITAPAPELKRLQRRILDNFLTNVPVNDCVHGFIRERSCATNARLHVRKQVVAKLDIRSFFPATPYHLIVKALRTAAGGTISQGALFLLTDICSYQGGLPVGAPTSPTLGNIILSRFDEVMADRCAKNEVTYTRYADDLVFSGDNRAVPMLGVAKRLLEKLGYQTDAKKELIMRKGRRQSVTGLVVNEEANIPRRQRRRLRAALHGMAHGKEPHWHGKAASREKIIGLLGYLKGVHKESAQRIADKYLPPRSDEASP